MEYNAQPFLMDDIDGFVAVGMQEESKGIASYCDEKRRYAIVAEHLYEVRVNAENREALKTVSSSAAASAGTEKVSSEGGQGREITVPLLPPRKHDFDFLMDLGNLENRIAEDMRKPMPLAHRRTRSEERIRVLCAPNDIDGLMAVGDPSAVIRASSLSLTERDYEIFDDPREKCRDFSTAVRRYSLQQKPPAVAYTIRMGNIDEKSTIMNLSLGDLIPKEKVLPDIDGFIALATTRATTEAPKSKRTGVRPMSTGYKKTDEKNRSEPTLKSSNCLNDDFDSIDCKSGRKPPAHRPRRNTDAPRPSAILKPWETFDIDTLLQVGGDDEDESLLNVLPLPKSLAPKVRDRKVSEQQLDSTLLVCGSVHTPVTLDIDEMMQLASITRPVSATSLSSSTKSRNHRHHRHHRSSGSNMTQSLPKLSTGDRSSCSLDKKPSGPSTAPPNQETRLSQSDRRQQQLMTRATDPTLLSESVPLIFATDVPDQGPVSVSDKSVSSQAGQAKPELEEMLRWGQKLGETMRSKYSGASSEDSPSNGPLGTVRAPAAS